MSHEEIIRKEARAALGQIDNTSVKNSVEAVMSRVTSAMSRFHAPHNKVVFLTEVIQQVQASLETHRLVCARTGDCPIENKMQEVLFFLEQEADALPRLAPVAGIAFPPSIKDAMPAHDSPSLINKIFISHSSENRAIVEDIIDLLGHIKVRSEQIFCSSFPGYGTELGQDFLQRIKDELNGNVLVLFVLTPEFYSSVVSLCEMGAAWVKTNKHIPIVVPPFEFKSVKGVIPFTHGLKANDPLEWNQLKEQLEKWLAIENKEQASVWERKRDKSIKLLNSKIKAATDKSLILEQKTNRPARRGGLNSSAV